MFKRSFRQGLPQLAGGIVLSKLLTSAALAATYTQNFDEFADGTTDLLDGTTIGSSVDGVAGSIASVQSGALRLTVVDTNSQRASFRIPALADSSQGWTMTFDYTITDAVGGNPPADGFTLSYGAIPDLTESGAGPNGHGNAEAGHGSGNEISFQVDTWQNGAANSPGVGILQNGTAIAGGRVDGIVVPTDGSVSGTMTIVWTPITTDFNTTGLETDAEFNSLSHSFVGDDTHSWVFSARTGGATEDLIIDNLVIMTGSSDTDGDGLPDSWETFYGLDPDDNGLNPNNNGVPGDPDQGADGDPDMDTLTNTEELALGTDPMEKDTDMDGLDDNVEDKTGIYVGPSSTGTDPTIVDTDGDMLPDGVEDPTLPFVDINQPGTDPNNPNTDGDNLEDGIEIPIGRDPTVPDDPLPGSSYVQNFDGYPDGATNLGDGTTIGSSVGGAASTIASVQSDALLLTQVNTNNQRASFRIPALPGSSQGWTATWDYTMTDAVGGNPPADGFTFNWGPIPELVTQGAAADGHGAAEAGMGTGNEISAQIDTWRNDDPNMPGVGILESGANILDGRTDGIVIPNDGTVTGTMTVVWTPETITFETTGLETDATFVELPHTFIGDDTYSWAFSARTGGATEDLIIDNLEIRIGTPGDDFRILSIEKVVVPGVDPDPDTISVTVTWQSREGRDYGVYSSPDLRPENLLDWNELDDAVPGEVGQETTSYTDTGIPIDTERLFYMIRDNTDL